MHSPEFNIRANRIHDREVRGGVKVTEGRLQWPLFLVSGGNRIKEATIRAKDDLSIGDEARSRFKGTLYQSRFQFNWDGRNRVCTIDCHASGLGDA